ncbi:hypothetical protein K458DRAFT_421746 [Lentithecium fluviatile CBS 122367]|uniref:Uncharacterized protein n=1 Tax=Lentithecium fluviatile CBS 122367 TaxID=1168545 RepID=A0A6G1IPN1_9PLEO|nr:hypothetical protein K458DRAFT_421746 [Lentithecium fluviatile CBS 122367]
MRAPLPTQQSPSTISILANQLSFQPGVCMAIMTCSRPFVPNPRAVSSTPKVEGMSHFGFVGVREVGVQTLLGALSHSLSVQPLLLLV